MAVDNNCTSKQTFCQLNKEYVRQNPELVFSYNGCITQTEIIDNDTWNELIQAIIKVYNYGHRGTRNPSTPLNLTPDTSHTYTTVGNETSPTNTISTTKQMTKYQSNYDSIDWNDYTQILNTLNMTVPQDHIIYGNYFQQIANTLNNYRLNNTRCNNCNTGCNIQCQARSQCCTTQCCTNCCTNCCTDTGSSEDWWCGSNSCSNNGCYRTQ